MLKTLEWVMGLELPEGGISAYPGSAAYPEVSGYLIPTLYDYGEDGRVTDGRITDGRVTDPPLQQTSAREMAVRLAEWLLTIQDEAGWFPDMHGKPRAFDTGACMEGLGRAYQETGRADFQDGATRAWNWLESLKLDDGTLRTAPNMKKTHLYMLRVSGLMGDEAPVKAWKTKAWDVTRVHYIAYALEGLWMLLEDGFVIAQLLLARKAITADDLMPFTAGASWKTCEGTDTCATAQMAILYHKAGMEDDARRLAHGVSVMALGDGSIPLGKEHSERNSWTAKWCLDMWKVLG